MYTGEFTKINATTHNCHLIFLGGSVLKVSLGTTGTISSLSLKKKISY